MEHLIVALISNMIKESSIHIKLSTVEGKIQIYYRYQVVTTIIKCIWVVQIITNLSVNECPPEPYKKKTL